MKETIAALAVATLLAGCSAASRSGVGSPQTSPQEAQSQRTVMAAVVPAGPAPVGKAVPDTRDAAPAPTPRPPKAAKISRSEAITIAWSGLKAAGRTGVLGSATLTTSRQLLSGAFGDWTVGGSPGLRLDDPIWLVQFNGEYADGIGHYHSLTEIIDANSGKPFGERLAP